MSEEGSGRKFRFDFGKLSFAEVYNHLRLGDIKRWALGWKYHLLGVGVVAGGVLAGYLFLPSQADLFQAEQEKKALETQLSRARVDSIQKERETRLLVQGYQQDTSAYGARLRSLEGETEEKVATAVRKTESRQLENEIGKLQSEIAGILSQHPYLLETEYTMTDRDQDADGKVDVTSYRAKPRGGSLAVDVREPARLEATLSILKKGQLAYTGIKAELRTRNLKEEQILAFQQGKIKVDVVYLSDAEARVSLENVVTGGGERYNVVIGNRRVVR